MTRRHFSAIGLLLSAACGGDGPGTSSPASWPPTYDEVALAEAPDLDPRPDVVAVRLSARAASVNVSGQTVPLWTYEGRVPGPLIRARRGDTLVVDLRNELPAPTTIHWHGVRVPSAMDGAHLTQDPVPPGGSFHYEFPLLDAGLFWLHPHHDSSDQVARGLYAPLLVEEREESGAERALGRSAVLVLSDLSPDGEAATAATLQGRQGDVVLVNGQDRPTVRIPAGARQRWRLVNAARSRFMRLSVTGQQLQLVGGDGGLLEEPLPPHDEILLTPGERAEVVVSPRGSAGTRTTVKLLAHDRGGGVSTEERELFYLELQAPAGPAAPAVSGRLRTIERLSVGASTTRQVIRIGARPDGFVVNDHPGHAHLSARVGETQILQITNHTAFDHPFHLHGFFFQVLDASGRVAEPVQWKDTLNLQALSSAQVAVFFDDRPGPWMFHCHILDHAELGLAGVIDVTR